MNARYVLRANPVAVPTCDELASRLSDQQGVEVLDRSPRMLLVAGEHGALADALSGSSGWSLIPETTTPRPDPRVRVRRKP